MFSDHSKMIVKVENAVIGSGRQLVSESSCQVRLSSADIDVIHKLSIQARSSVFALNGYLIYDRGYCFRPRPSVEGEMEGWVLRGVLRGV